MDSQPTVCVSRWWAGVDSLREQKKPEARKTLENAAESHQSASKIEKDTADRCRLGQTKTVVQHRSPCPVQVEPEQLLGLEDRLLARACFYYTDRRAK